MMDIIGVKDIALMGRQQNAVVMQYDKTIVITSDIVKHQKDEQEPHITIDAVAEKIDLFAKQIMLEGKDSNHAAESVVYGESLVELLRWMIDVLKTHKHPPNAPPIPDFFGEATSRARSMDSDLLNKRVKSR